MIDPALLAECRSLSLVVAPELGRHPLYVVQRPSDYPAMLSSCHAFSISGVDLFMRKRLVEAGTWLGPGALVVLNDDFQGDRTWTLGVVLHEIAHCLPSREPRPDREPTESQFAFQTLLLKAADEYPPEPSPFDEHHDHRFLRRVCHLRYRALRAGVEIPLPMLHAAGADYNQSPLARYYRAMGSELEQMQTWSFSEIERTKVRPEFQALYLNDLSYQVEHSNGRVD